MTLLHAVWFLLLLVQRGIVGLVTDDDGGMNFEGSGSVIVYLRNKHTGKLEKQMFVPHKFWCFENGSACRPLEEDGLDKNVLGHVELPVLPLNTSGYFGQESPKTNASGALIEVVSAVNGEGTITTACEGTMVHKLREGLRWVALIERGGCKFDQKMQFARQYNASAVLVYNHNSGEPVYMSHKASEVPSLMIFREPGRNMALVARHALNLTGDYAYVEITLQTGSAMVRMPNNNRVAVVVVAIVVVAVTIISLIWLVYYYIQKQRTKNKAEKLRQLIAKGVRKALRKLGEKTVQSGDEVTRDGHDCTYCLEEFHPGDIIRDLPCRHKFHKVCVDNWLIEHRTCPNCKEDFLVSLGVKIKGIADSEDDNTTRLNGHAELSVEDSQNFVDNTSPSSIQQEPEISSSLQPSEDLKVNANSSRNDISNLDQSEADPITNKKSMASGAFSRRHSDKSFFATQSHCDEQISCSSPFMQDTGSDAETAIEEDSLLDALHPVARSDSGRRLRPDDSLEERICIMPFENC